MNLRDTFLEDLHKGRYSSLPLTLRTLMVCACNEENAFHVYVKERPTQIERDIEKYKLQGITVERPHKIEWNSSWGYRLKIVPKSFLSNLEKFYLTGF